MNLMIAVTTPEGIILAMNQPLQEDNRTKLSILDKFKKDKNKNEIFPASVGVVGVHGNYSHGMRTELLALKDAKMYDAGDIGHRVESAINIHKENVSALVCGWIKSKKTNKNYLPMIMIMKYKNGKCFVPEMELEKYGFIVIGDCQEAKDFLKTEDFSEMGLASAKELVFTLFKGLLPQREYHDNATTINRVHFYIIPKDGESYELTRTIV